MQKILIVEDDDGVASLVRKIVEEEGFITEIASDADGGWSALIAHDPDAAIVDIWLYGRETGWDLLEKIRANEHFHDLPVVVLTGVTGPEATERAQALGCEYVSKPFSPAILIDRLQRLIRAAGRSPAMREMPVVLLAGFYRIEGDPHPGRARPLLRRVGGPRPRPAVLPTGDRGEGDDDRRLAGELRRGPARGEEGGGDGGSPARVTPGRRSR